MVTTPHLALNLLSVYNRRSNHANTCAVVMLCMQVVIVPIVKKDTDRASVNEAVDKLTAALKQASVRVKVSIPSNSAVCIIHCSCCCYIRTCERVDPAHNAGHNMLHVLESAYRRFSWAACNVPDQMLAVA